MQHGNTVRWVHSRSLQSDILARCRCHHGDCSAFRSLELGKCHWPLQAALSGSIIKAPGFAGGYLHAPCHQRRHRRRHCRGICRAGDPQPRSANKLDLDHTKRRRQSGRRRFADNPHRSKIRCSTSPRAQLASPTIQLARMYPGLTRQRRYHHARFQKGRTRHDGRAEFIGRDVPKSLFSGSDRAVGGHPTAGRPVLAPGLAAGSAWCMRSLPTSPTPCRRRAEVVITASAPTRRYLITCSAVSTPDVAASEPRI